MNVIFAILVTYNLSQIISESTFPLFRWLRNLEGNWFKEFISELTSCFLCTSVWIGVLVSFLLFDYAKYLEIQNLSLIWSGLFYSCCAWFLHCLEVNFGQRT